MENFGLCNSSGLDCSWLSWQAELLQNAYNILLKYLTIDFHDVINEQTARLHTVTHLLNGALRKVLGDEISQRGSNITSERLRFDFSFGRKVTKEELIQVEAIVNEAIGQNIDVILEEMAPEKAYEEGAVGVFTGKYGEIVKVYTIPGYSKEICGGPHAKNTGELVSFKILKEEASSAGVRRIKAVIDTAVIIGEDNENVRIQDDT